MRRGGKRGCPYTSEPDLTESGCNFGTGWLQTFDGGIFHKNDLPLTPSPPIPPPTPSHPIPPPSPSMETLTIGDKRIGIRTSVLEEKATACNMLCCYADELKEGFFPWIEQVAQLMVPLLKFYFHEEVRKAAVQCEWS